PAARHRLPRRQPAALRPLDVAARRPDRARSARRGLRLPQRLERMGGGRLPGARQEARPRLPRGLARRRRAPGRAGGGRVSFDAWRARGRAGAVRMIDEVRRRLGVPDTLAAVVQASPYTQPPEEFERPPPRLKMAPARADERAIGWRDAATVAPR